MQQARLVVGISGASGTLYGIRLLQKLAAIDWIETHLVMTKAAKLTCSVETEWSIEAVEALADQVHDNRNIGATIASGSFATMGMVVPACSIKTLSAIAHSYADSLLVRAADVMLKERRPLVLMPRETPLHVGHCELLLKAAQMGAVIAPPMPAFYNLPETIDDLVDHSVSRVLDLLAIEQPDSKRWQGL
ncbi:UbiX family flavin prenyltransferase [Gammaproteobacteria bacterium LSUCC0057]|uniref:Flavin prenyltransferase UbiX n=1 Tax=Gammaproteobacteria bacterium LSUCC0057 TaxID=2559237 RepID=A0A4Y8UJS7_9GAMM|nr:UbiX family flavin prenyltransferase [Gammaproteobacteria bacterium LSUCC0057]